MGRVLERRMCVFGTWPFEGCDGGGARVEGEENERFSLLLTRLHLLNRLMMVHV